VKVSDASVVLEAVTDDPVKGERARVMLESGPVAAPHLIDMEVLAGLRRLVRHGHLSAARAERAVARLTMLPLHRHDHALLLRRCWDLRENVTPYDAAYVALAEALGVPLLTADARLASAPGIRCEVELLT
jgi:predicted nucleic acid-binding protein